MPSAYAHPFRLDGKVVLVTGASRGLGREMAVALGAAGATVAGTGRDLAALADTQREVEATGAKFVGLELDVTDSAAVDKAVEHTASTLGGLDVAIANAGVGLMKPAVDTTDDDWQWVMRSNLDGSFYTCRSAGRLMLQQGHGKVIVVSSDIGIRGSVGWSAYSASKGGLITLSKTLAWEWAPTVTVNCLAPGAFETDINRHLLAIEGVKDAVSGETPLARLGLPSELGPVSVFLASSASDFMTGVVLPFDGGIRRS